MYHELSISTCSILRYSSSYPSLVKQIHQISLVTSLSWVAFKIWFYFRIQVEIKPWSFSCETVLSKLCFLGSQAFLPCMPFFPTKTWNCFWMKGNWNKYITTKRFPTDAMPSSDEFSMLKTFQVVLMLVILSLPLCLNGLWSRYLLQFLSVNSGVLIVFIHK